MNHDLDVLKLMLEAGIIVQLVVILLLVCSIFSWSIYLMKSKQFKVVEKENIMFLERFRKLNSFQDAPMVITDSSESPMCRMLEESYNTYLKIVEIKGEEGARKQIESFGLSSMSRAMQAGALESASLLNKN